MEIKNMLPGQVVKIIGGKYKGQAGQIRAILPERGMVTVKVRGECRTIKAENVEANHG